MVSGETPYSSATLRTDCFFSRTRRSTVGHAEEGMAEGRSCGRRGVSRTRGVWAFSSSARWMCSF